MVPRETLYIGSECIQKLGSPFLINYFRDYKLENAAQVGGRPIAVGLRSHDLGPAYLALDGKCHGLNYCTHLMADCPVRALQKNIRLSQTKVPPYLPQGPPRSALHSVSEKIK